MTMNQNLSTSPAALAIRTDTLEKAVNKMSDVLENMGRTHNEIVRLVGLAQQIQQQHDVCIKELKTDVSDLKESRTVLIGGWKAACAVGVIIIGASGVSGAACSYIAMKQQPPKLEGITKKIIQTE